MDWRCSIYAKTVKQKSIIMKSYMTVLFFLLICKSLVCQVNNDSCLSATEILPAFGINNSNCNGLFGFDVSITTSNINSIPNLPYPAMKDCEGYSNSTSVYANDVWFKLKTLGGIIYVYRVKNSLDSIHLNIWHGNNCSNLKPSGCFTFDLISKFEQYGIFCGDTLNAEYTYLQFSGNEINRVGNLEFCIKGLPCSNIWYFGTTGLKNHFFKPSFEIYPNPFSSNTTIYIASEISNFEIAIFDIHGNLVKREEYHNSNKLILERDQLISGVYMIRMTNLNSGYRELRSIAISDQ